MHSKVILLGTPVDNLTMDETLDELEKFIEVGRATGRTHQIATINADFVTNALSDPEQMALLQNADLNMPDGMPIVWGARMLHVPMQERVAGVDTVLRLAERAEQKGYSIYFLGAAPGVAERAVKVILQKHPGLMIAGVSAPMVPASLETDPKIIDEIKTSRADILLVAFGNPKQEKWINAHRSQVHVPVMIGVGGTLDLISGHKVRAPRWMHGSGLEWTFRLAQEPKRLWRRYSKNIFIFLPQVARQWWVMRPRGPSAAALRREDILVVGQAAVIPLSGSLRIENVIAFEQIVQEVLAKTPQVLLDCSRVNYLDSSALGGLVRLAHQARQLGGDLVLTGVSDKLAGLMRMLHLERYFCLYPDLESGVMAFQPPGTAECFTKPVLYPESALIEF